MKVDIKLPGLFGLGLLWIIFLALGYFTSWRMGLQWFSQAGLLWFWVWYLTWKRADLNRISTDTPLLNDLGWANRLTLLRGYLIALTGGFLFQPDIQGFISWIPGLLYGAAAILDRVDGFVARRSKQTTLLGAELDTVFDALGLLVAPLLAIVMGKIHWSYLSLSFAFYIFNWGIYWRCKHGLNIYPLMPSQLRRALAGFQMGFVALALLPCFAPQQTVVCGFAFLIPVVLGFTFDWLVVSGRINGESVGAKLFFSRLVKISRNIFQPCLRIFLFVGSIFMLYKADIFEPPGSIFLTLSLVLGISLVLLGSAGRVGALIVLLLLAGSAAPITPLSIGLLCSGAWLLLLGTGRFSLWQWDDVWVNRQDGASA
ncbi:MAG: CDP-alcohol phosphatidyltransferase family protein [Gammaproteobacteria bacterium]|nr:MAG: CDP-alcohol phosphatidyltransferase family protein [Gammaproteobacteria bacterium]